MILAVEDSLTEILVKKILSEVRPDISNSIITLPLNGKSYLESKARNLNRTAAGSPVFLFTDLDDRNDCPINLILRWVPEPRHRNFLFRVVTMEIESWILGDRQAFSYFFSIPLNRIPQDTESIDNPKGEIVSLARRSRKKQIREDVIPQFSGTAKVGPAYNACLSAFINENWDINNALTSSESLRRAVDRIRNF